MRSLISQANNLEQRAEEQLELITGSERAEWLRHPLTQWFVLRCAAEEMDIAAHWAEGAYVHQDGDADSTAQINAKELGRCQAYGDMRDWMLTLSSDEDDDLGEDE